MASARTESLDSRVRGRGATAQFVDTLADSERFADGVGNAGTLGLRKDDRHHREDERQGDAGSLKGRSLAAALDQLAQPGHCSPPDSAWPEVRVGQNAALHPGPSVPSVAC